MFVSVIVTNKFELNYKEANNWLAVLAIRTSFNPAVIMLFDILYDTGLIDWHIRVS